MLFHTLTVQLIFFLSFIIKNKKAVRKISLAHQFTFILKKEKIRFVKPAGLERIGVPQKVNISFD